MVCIHNVMFGLVPIVETKVIFITDDIESFLSKEIIIILIN